MVNGRLLVKHKKGIPLVWDALNVYDISSSLTRTAAATLKSQRVST